LHHLFVVNCKVRVKEQYLKLRVELQERLENIVFVPRSSASNPLLRIFERPKYVMKMYDNTLPEPWQDVGQKMHDIATNFCDMRGVYKEDIVGIQSRKPFKRNVLNCVYDYLVLFHIFVAQQRKEPFGIRFYECEYHPF